MRGSKRGRVTYLGYWYEIAAVGSGSASIWQGQITIGKLEDGLDADILLEYIVPGEFENMLDAIAAVDNFARGFIDHVNSDE